MTNEAELLAIVRPAIAEKPTAYWAERLREADIMHERLNTFREFLRQPQTEAIGLISWLEPRRRARARPRAERGRHARRWTTARRAALRPSSASTRAEVLREHGFAAADIAALIERGVVAQA